MTSEQIKTFLLIVETKSFTHTAKELFITQSSVSKRIHELENELGQALFYRSHSGIYLTNYGKIFKRYAQQIMNIEEKVLEEMDKANRYSSHLIIGTVYAYYDMYLCKTIKQFTELYPNIAVTVRFGHTSQILSQLMNNSVDIAFTHRPIDYSDYVCRMICQDQMVLVTDPQNELYKSEISFEDIKNLPVIDTNFLYAPTRKKLFPLSYQPQVTVEVASCAIKMLKGSRFFALFPYDLVRKQLESSLFSEVKITGETIPPVNNFMIYSKNFEEESGIKEFIKAVVSEQADLV